MIGLLLSGLGTIKHRQDGDVSDRTRRQAWLNSRDSKRRMPRMSSMTEETLDESSDSLAGMVNPQFRRLQHDSKDILTF